jgi:hypothetical protein
MDGWRGHGPAVDHGSRVHDAPAKGVRADLICAVPRGSGGLGRMQAVRGRGQRQTAAHGGVGGETRRSSLENKLQGLVWLAAWSYTKLRRRQTCPGACGGASSYGQGIAPLGQTAHDRRAVVGAAASRCKGKRARWFPYHTVMIWRRKGRQRCSGEGDRRQRPEVEDDDGGARVKEMAVL